MAYRTLDFDDGTVYDVENRPVETVTLLGPGGYYGTKEVHLDAIVDTGADHMHLPTEAAEEVGIDLSGAVAVILDTAGGSVTMDQLEVGVDIHGRRVTVPVNFAPGAEALLGRQAIFEALGAAGFTTSEWLLQYIPPSAG
ncbi:MAG TPA: retropepsin-like aspartic protease [Dehalococcoidia bacterium]